MLDFFRQQYEGYDFSGPFLFNCFSRLLFSLRQRGECREVYQGSWQNANDVCPANISGCAQLWRQSQYMIVHQLYIRTHVICCAIFLYVYTGIIPANASKIFRKSSHKMLTGISWPPIRRWTRGKLQGSGMLRSVCKSQ